jgi:hypothetical protein
VPQVVRPSCERRGHLFLGQREVRASFHTRE